MSAPRSTILAIDDTEEVRRLLEETLRQSHLVKTAPDGNAALALAREPARPDLILLDTKLAAASGFELCKALRALPGFAEAPVIFLAERRNAQDLVQAFRLDAIDFFVKPLSAPTIRAGIEARLEQLAHERSAQLRGSERRVARLVRAMQWHDSSLGGKRTRRLAGYARALGEAAGASEVARELLMRAAQLHDVGKLGVPAELLRKERNLSGAERELFERHAALGAEIIGEHYDALLKLARTIALTHHERWDGAGYPGRLQANQIPWAGRVMAIVDAFESMTTPQYGGAATSFERAVAEIGTAAGKQFDPALVEALRKALPAFRQVYQAHAEHPADDDFVIGEAAHGARHPAAPADDDFVIGAAADGAPRPAAPADDDFVIGAAADGARRPVAPADDDLVIGAVAAGAVEGSELASTERLREAMQPASAPAALPAPTLESPVAAQAPARAELALESGQAAAAERHRAEQTQLQAQIKSFRARVNDLEAERAATVAALSQARATQDELARLGREREAAEERHRREQSELHGQLESLRARVQELEGELDRARARVNELEVQSKLPRPQAKAETLRAQVKEVEAERAAALAALSQARAELDRLGREREVAGESHRREQSELHGQLESLRARVQELEGERGITQAALAQAKVELDAARARVNEVESELRRPSEGHAAAEERHSQERARLQAQVENLSAQVKGVEKERAAAVAALSQARATQDELARVGQEREFAEERHRREQSELHGQLESLRARVKELEGERGITRAALAQAKVERDEARVRVNELEAERTATVKEVEEERAAARAEVQAALVELEKRRAAAESALAQREPSPPAQGSHPVVLVVAFLLGGLAVAVTFVFGLYYIQGIVP